MATMLTSSAFTRIAPQTKAIFLSRLRVNHISLFRRRAIASPIKPDSTNDPSLLSIITRHRTQLRHTKIRPMRTNAALISPAVALTPYALWTVLLCCAATAQWLESHSWLGQRLSAPLMTMALTLILSNTGAIPAESPVYQTIWTVIMPLAAALCLLETDIRQLFVSAGDSLLAFGFGSVGTILGTVVAFLLCGSHLPGNEGWKIAACLCASYVGGSINYAATAKVLHLTTPGLLVAGMAADNLLMAAYFGVIMTLSSQHKEEPPSPDEPSKNELEEVKGGLTIESVTAGLAGAAVSCQVPILFLKHLPGYLSGMELGLTAVIASVMASAAGIYQESNSEAGSEQVKAFSGAGTIGGALMLLFFAVVGATASISDCISAGWSLLIFGAILLSVHLSVALLLGRFAGLPLDVVLIASNANVGGPATSAAMAKACKWNHLVQPALLMGTLGYVVGTAIGSVVGSHVLLPFLV